MTAPRSVRFGESLGSLLPDPSAGPWVVAVSGGLDSVVLLHLLRFRSASAPKLVVGHFDHAMRPESADDALWVRGVARAWGIECHLGRAERALATEEEARAARYAFLESVRARAGASAILTAHHADDQAETVLFRILRGTGSTGLVGMRPSREGSVYRPLLPFWREELEDYAGARAISWREDATNASTDRARNAIRNLILPAAERSGMPGARRALVRLAALAARDEAAWDEQVEAALERIDYDELRPARGVSRAGFLSLSPALQARVLRSLLGRHRGAVDQAGIDRALDFIRERGAGRSHDLAGTTTLRLDLGRVVVAEEAAVTPDRELELADGGEGSGAVSLGGRRWSVSWGPAIAPGSIVGSFALDPDQFPARLRARRPGDRIRLAAGSRKLKKVLLEARVPLADRPTLPVLVDARGTVLWVAGVARSVDALEGATRLTIGIGP